MLLPMRDHQSHITRASPHATTSARHCTRPPRCPMTHACLSWRGMASRAILHPAAQPAICSLLVYIYSVLVYIYGKGRGIPQSLESVVRLALPQTLPSERHGLDFVLGPTAHDQKSCRVHAHKVLDGGGIDLDGCGIVALWFKGRCDGLRRPRSSRREEGSDDLGVDCIGSRQRRRRLVRLVVGRELDCR